MIEERGDEIVNDMRLLVFCLVTAVIETTSALSLPHVFGHNMVLQCDRSLPVWGAAVPGTEIEVAFAGQAVSARTRPDGKWRTELNALSASEIGRNFVVRAVGSQPQNTLVFTNVVVGEVWFCSGQSNMEFRMGNVKGSAHECAAAHWPLIRHFRPARCQAEYPRDDVIAAWEMTTPQTIASQSAVAFFFGETLHKNLNVPVGLINSSWGGSVIEAWMPAGHVDDLFALQQLIPLRKGRRYDAMTVIWNGMVSGLVPYAIRGAVWYQGCANVGDGSLYLDKLEAMVKGWRREWGEGEFPFYLVQLAPHAYARFGGADGTALAEVQEAQAKAVDRIPNSGYVVINDVGEVKNIHPTDKRTVGMRLADQVLERVYGKPGRPWRTPTFREAVRDGASVRIRLKDAEGLRTRDGKAPTCFELREAFGDWRTAAARIDGAEVVLSDERIKKPAAFRFAAHNGDCPNLVNGDGLPAGPFRGDIPDVAAKSDFVRLGANRDPEKGTDWLKVGLWAYPMVMDWDRDGKLDLVVTTPSRPYKGVYFFRNLGNGIFDKAVKLSESSQQNVVLSRTAGRNVVTCPKGVIWKFTGDLGNKIWRPLAGVPENPCPDKVRGNVRRFVDFDGDGRDDVVIGTGCWKDYGWADAYDERGNWTNAPIASAIYWCRNLEGRGENAKYDRPVEVRLKDGGAFQTYGNPSPMFEDWDGDGDLDLLCGSFIDGFHYYENTGTRGVPVYESRGELKRKDGRRMALELEMIKPTAVDWDDDGLPDLVVGDEDGRVAWLRNEGRLRDGLPLFEAPVYFRQRSDELNFGALSTPFAVDWDGDGDQDLICGNSAGNLAFIENLSGNGVSAPIWANPRLMRVNGRVFRIMARQNGSIQGPAECKWGYTVPTVADWDGDGRLDIMINSIYGDVVWLRNPGGKNVLELEVPRPVEVEWEEEPPSLAWGWRKPQGKALLTQWRTTPVMIDWNRDGLMDLVMLDVEGYLAFFERFKDASGTLKLKAPRRIFFDESGTALRLNDKTAGASGRRKICFCDWDGDGRLDLIANSKNAELYRNLGMCNGGVRFENPVEMGKRVLAGHTTCPTACDFDADGEAELLLGAEDGFFYLLDRGSQTIQ